ncbi:MAG: precorrin-6Y C5,15-methyltransferase (decarboxylating) subunit CbiT, partial [Planctomycetia bacterium]
AYLTNVAGQPLEVIVERIRTAEKVGVFTHEETTPAVLAKTLLGEGIDYFRVYVCENLGARNEVVTQATLAEIAGSSFSPLNVTILVRLPNVPDRRVSKFENKVFGNPDEAFHQTRPNRGLLTPSEVRAIALAQMRIRPDGVVWDVGAGSGAVSIEAAQLAADGKVFAIEPDPEDCGVIQDNAAAFGVMNIEIVCGRAPDVFDKLPTPNSVFVGGIGREILSILPEAFDRLPVGGALVTNLATLEHVSAATSVLKSLTPSVGVLMVNLARGTYQLDTIRFEALNPSFILFVTKPAAERGDGI